MAWRDMIKAQHIKNECDPQNWCQYSWCKNDNGMMFQYYMWLLAQVWIQAKMWPFCWVRYRFLAMGSNCKPVIQKKKKKIAGPKIAELPKTHPLDLTIFCAHFPTCPLLYLL